MIRDLSTTLDALLTDPAATADFPDLATATVAFERPTDTFSPGSSAINLFLFDIRENLDLRSNEPFSELVGNEVVLHQPPRRIDCSYLVTAWPVGGTDLPLQEHRLLGQVLQLFSRQPTIPTPLLRGSLIGQEPPLPLMVPQIDGLKSPAEFWTAMGSKMRAALTVTVTIAMPATPPLTAFPVATVRGRAGADGVDGAADEPWVTIGSVVSDSGGNPLAGAVVDVVDARLRAVTDSLGRYRFPRVPVGSRTLRAVAVGFQPASRVVQVPTTRPEDYAFNLNP